MSASMKDSGSDEVVFATWKDVALIFVLPFSVMMCSGYIYSANSLYFREKDWTMWHLGLSTLTGFGTRAFVVNKLIAAHGTWVAVPVVSVNLVLSTPALLYPENEICVLVQLYAIQGLMCWLAMDGLCFARFSHSKELLKRASRIQNLCVTTGYGMSPFVGGLLYDIGNWYAISIFNIILTSIILVLFCIQPPLHQSFESWRQKPAQVEQVSHFDGAIPIVVPDKHLEVAPRSSVLKRMSSVMIDWSSAKVKYGLFSPKLQRTPAKYLALAQFANCAAYMVEWMLFAIYFREQYGWNEATWAGVAQMSGDLAGAAMLVANSHFKKRAEASTTAAWNADASTTSDSRRSICERIWSAFTSKPYNLSFLLLCWTILNLLLASPILIAAVTAQVIEGTVFVFFVQWLNEMNQFYAFGDSDVYIKLQSISSNMLAVACATSGPAALLLYEIVDPTSPFLITAGFAFFVMIVYTVAFCRRSGFSHNFEETERVLCTSGKEGETKVLTVKVKPASDGSNA